MAAPRDTFPGSTSPMDPAHWRWLPPMSIGGEVVTRLLLGIAAASVAVLGLGLAFGAFPDLVAPRGLATGARLFVGAIGAGFGCQALAAWVDLPPRPLGAWRRSAGTWLDRASLLAGCGAVALGIALGLGWLS